MEVSSVLRVISTVVSTSNGGTKIEPRMVEEFDPDPYKIDFHDPMMEIDPDSPRGNLLSAVA
jgi:hypothetical protein